MPITVSREGGVGVIALAYPPANAYTKPILEEFARAVDSVGADAAVRCVVVKSGIERFFSAGADIAMMKGASKESFTDFLAVAHSAMDRIAATPKIFLAAIRGHAVGGGLEIALACDLRLAAEGDYNLGLVEATLGVGPGAGGTQRLPRLIHRGRALELMVTGRAVKPKEALALGIVEHLYPADRFEAEVMAYAGRLAEGASYAQGLIKLSVNRGLAGPLADGLALERANQVKMFLSADAAEGQKAFLEKRRPRYTGR